LENRAPQPAAGSTKSTTKVDRDAEIAALAEHVSEATTGWIGKDKIRGALQHYESTASTDAARSRWRASPLSPGGRLNLHRLDFGEPASLGTSFAPRRCDRTGGGGQA
jgi:hypothetical protein